jgi:hypothetical protein
LPLRRYGGITQLARHGHGIERDGLRVLDGARIKLRPSERAHALDAARCIALRQSSERLSEERIDALSVVAAALGREFDADGGIGEKIREAMPARDLNRRLERRARPVKVVRLALRVAEAQPDRSLRPRIGVVLLL